MENTIHYGIGRDYLKDWGITEALREVYQNFLDYGEYREDITELGGISKVTISNDWQPDSLDFLRIGNSKKNNPDSIGKHGEGLKMAFLILLREGWESSLRTAKHSVVPGFYSDSEIGECFCFRYEDNHRDINGFEITFKMDSAEFEAFHSNVIKPEDVIFSEPFWGDLVDKPKGNIYSGGLFVANDKNIPAAYNILPHKLPLDRDRRVPVSFDLRYAVSRIVESYGKFKVEDLDTGGLDFVQKVPVEVKKEFKPIKVGNSIEFQYKDSQGKDQVLKNTHVKEQLHKDSFFQKAIAKIKNVIAKQLGLYDLLIEFERKYKYSLPADGKNDLDIILSKAGKLEKKPKRKVIEEGLPF